MITSLSSRVFSRIAAVAVLLVAGTILAAHPARAGYDSNNIIDDSKFVNHNTMDQAGIQAFLAARGSYLAGYVDPQVNQSAAQIIRDASVDFGINPQVIMSTLQKEQSLITNPSPTASNIRSAMGYGCPTTGYCDPSLAGFYNQVRNGSWQLKFNFERAGGNNGTWTGPSGAVWGNPSILYPCRNTTSLYSTGLFAGRQVTFYAHTNGQAYATVGIANRATAAMYCYTPHVYNPSGVPVYYSGSYNFVTFYERWFGPTSGSPLFSISGSGAVYLEYAGAYYLFPSQTVLAAYGYAGVPVKVVDASYVSSMENGSPLSTLARYDGNAAVYLVDSGRRLSFPSPDMLVLHGYSGGQETVYPASLQNFIASGGEMTSILRNPGGGIYLLENSKLRGFPDYETYANLGVPVYASRALNNMSWTYMARFQEDAPMLLDGKVLKGSGSPAIYIHDGGRLFIFTPQTYQAWGYGLDYVFSDAVVSKFTTDTAPIRLTTPDGARYYVDNGAKKRLDSTTQSAYGLLDNQFVAMSSRSGNRLRTATMSLVIQGSSPAVFLVSGGRKLPFSSPIDMAASGFGWNSIDRVSDQIVNALPTGPASIGVGSLIRLPTGQVSVIDEDGRAYIINSLEEFYALGYPWGAVRYVSAGALNGYDFSPMSSILSASGKKYILDSGKIYELTTAQEADYIANPSSVLAVTPTLINKYPRAQLTSFIQGSGFTVYKVVDGQKLPISSPVSLFANGGNWSSIVRVSDRFLQTLPVGSTL